jgi:hypothetical protein
VERLELGTVGLDHVDRESAGAALLQGAVEDRLRSGSPQRHLDPVRLLEGVHDGAKVARLGGGVDGERAFLLRAFEEPLHPVGTLVLGDLGGAHAGLRLTAGAGGQQRAGDCRPHGGANGNASPRLHHTGSGTGGGSSACSAS